MISYFFTTHVDASMRDPEIGQPAPACQLCWLPIFLRAWPLCSFEAMSYRARSSITVGRSGQCLCCARRLRMSQWLAGYIYAYVYPYSSQTDLKLPLPTATSVAQSN